MHSREKSVHIFDDILTFSLCNWNIKQKFHERCPFKTLINIAWNHYIDYTAHGFMQLKASSYEDLFVYIYTVLCIFEIENELWEATINSLITYFVTKWEPAIRMKLCYDKVLKDNCCQVISNSWKDFTLCLLLDVGELTLYVK